MLNYKHKDQIDFIDMFFMDAEVCFNFFFLINFY